MEKLKNHFKPIIFVFWLVVTLLPIMGMVWSLVSPIDFYNTQDQYRAFLAEYTRYAPLMFIVIQILQVVVTPISHYSIGYMGGFLFGPVWGSLYNYIGRVIGHVTAFIISRFFSRTVVQRFVPESTLKKYNSYTNHPAGLFLIYFLPLFPDDEISYLVGLSKMRFKYFLIANLLGQVGGSMSLAYLGAGIDTKDPVFWILFSSTLAGFPILYFIVRRERKKMITLEIENMK